jgi:hypothetical protein
MRRVDAITDDQIRELIGGAIRLYVGFDEVYRPHLAEAVLRQLPPDFDRSRVDRLLAEALPYQL